jgi:hypothetical protein
MKQFIFGGYSSLSVGSPNKTLLKSSIGSVVDFARDSDISRVGGILCSFKSVPIAFWGVGTLNNMVFSRKLWEMLLDNVYLKRALEDGSHFGEAFHANREEVLYPDVACRVTNFWLGDNNLVLGDVDILNTPNGVVVYTLAKISRVGISSRGFGELKDIGGGLKDVVPEDYLHICWDMVSFPAVPDASMTLIQGENALPTKELNAMSDQLRKLIRDASERHPDDFGLRSLWNSVEGGSRKPYNLRNEVISAMVAHRLHSGVTTLFSGQRRGIMSMAEAGFIRSEAILQLRGLVLEHFNKNFSFPVSWDFQSPVHTGKDVKSGQFLRWITTFKISGQSKEVVFVQGLNGVLSVEVDGERVVSLRPTGRLSLKDYRVLIERLG